MITNGQYILPDTLRVSLNGDRARRYRQSRNIVIKLMQNERFYRAIGSDSFLVNVIANCPLPVNHDLVGIIDSV